MVIEPINSISIRLQELGYIIEHETKAPGIQCLLYAHSPSPFRLGFAKVEDHFLYIDWENTAFGRKDSLLDIYKKFSGFVNQAFHVPHALRMHIPNLVVIAVSWDQFPGEIIQFVRTTTMTPWYGGETGQFILIEHKNMRIFCHQKPGFRESGSLPYSHGVEIITRSYSKHIPNTFS